MLRVNVTSRVPEPPDGDERGVLLGWLAFHRDALAAKCGGLDADQLVTRSAAPSRCPCSDWSVI
jgi:hypothetical protein